MIVVASVALLGGALVAIGNVLPQAPDTGRASPAVNPASPAASTAPASATPRPTRKPQTVTLMRVPEVPSIDAAPGGFFGWIRTTGEIPLYAVAGGTGDPIEILPAGFIGHASNASGPGSDIEDGWLTIDAPAPTGYIDASDPELVERFAEPNWGVGDEFYGLAAGPEGFVGWGSDATGTPVIYASPDGEDWRRADVPELSGGYLSGIAHGPAGWIAVCMVYTQDWAPLQLVLQSDDGLTWTIWGRLDEVRLGIGQLVGTDGGYLAVGGSSSGRAAAWSSADGLVWHEQTVAEMGGGWGRAWPVHGGVVISPGIPGRAWFTRDGTTWLAADDGPGGERTQIIELWDGLLAVDEDSGGRTRTWRGVIGTKTVTWEHLEEMDGALAETRLTALVQDGDQALAIGWDVTTGEPVVWRMTVAGWRSAGTLPEAMGGVPTVAASNAEDAVLVGYRPTLAGVNPVIWHLDGDRWLPEATPVIPLAPEPGGDACEPLPVDALTLLTVDTRAAVACHGSTPTTLRGFVGSCPDCFGGFSEDVMEPRWLADWSAPSLLISPLRDGQWGGMPLPIHPSLAFDNDWVGHEVEITGHFDDPAAADCRWLPGPSSIPWRLVPEETVNDCRTRFVVTALTVLD